MRVFNDFQEFPDDYKSVVIIGNFDGVHRGHRALIRRVRSQAGTRPVVALTFEPHPVRVLAPHLAPPLIYPAHEKFRLLAAAGVDAVLAQRFDRAFAALSPEVFVQDVLVAGLGASRVVVGYDFTFGAKRAGTTASLREMGERHGFEVDVVEAQVVGSGLVASSTKVREFVLEGRVQGAALILGDPFTLLGVIVSGKQRGRKLGFPTANLACENELLPKVGVYSGWLDYGVGPRAAVINVGHNPTFEETTDAPIVEAHVLDAADLSLYGAQARLGFLRRIRDERKFDGVDSLRAAIAADIGVARAHHAEHSG